MTDAEFAELEQHHLDSPGWFADRAPQIMAALRGLRSELADWQAKCETRSRELETAREEARRAEAARDEMQRELLEAQRDLADMKDAVAAAFGGHA